MKTLWLAVLLIVLDHVAKYWANTALIIGEPLAVLPHLNFTLVYNEGAAFSFLADMGGWQRWFFAVLALVVSVGLVYWLKKLPHRWSIEVVSINLILSGAVGNVIDRILFGKVTDFIDFYIGSWHYATFNIADICISIGAVLLIYSEFFVKSNKQKTEEASQ